MTEENDVDYRNNSNCRFCEKEFFSDRIRDHCHLTGKYRCPAHNTFNIFVKHKQSNFIPFVFHTFSKKDCHLFFRKLVDFKNDKVEIDVIP